MIKLAVREEMPFLELFDQFVSDSKKGKRLQPNGKRISEGTIANYTYTRLLLANFCRDKSFKLTVRNVRRLTLRQLQTEQHYWKKFYMKFTDYLYQDCGHFDNYVGATIKNIRTFFGYLNKTLQVQTGDFYKQFYVRKEEVPIVTLLPEELNFIIYNKEFEARLSPVMKKVKDVFAFGCTVALRFSDLMALKRSSLRINGSVWHLLVRSKKTSVDTQIRLPDYAITILMKYRKDKGGYLLPKFNVVNLNLYLKQLCKEAGFVHDVSKTRSKRGMAKDLERRSGKIKASYRFCDLVTTHTMRRTAITTMLSLGMAEHTVRKISGHSPMSKEFFRYVSVAQSYQDAETEMMFSKLKEKPLVPTHGLS